MSQRKYEQRIADHQGVFVRQSNILRKNIYEWDEMLRSSTGEDWPSMLGRLNAAMVRRAGLTVDGFFHQKQLLRSETCCSL